VLLNLLHLDPALQAAPAGQILIADKHYYGRRFEAELADAGLVELLALIPGITLLANAGYQGLSTPTAGAVITPRPARRKNQIPVFPALAAAHEADRRAHSAQRIRVEHGISHLKNWRALARHLGRRDHLETMLPAVAGLVSSQE
jgi:IS5 family transposase